MKFVLSQARALLVGVAMIVVTNGVVLAGVAYNRSGEPESTLRLTERELSIRGWSWPANENSSIDLYLDWRVAQGESKEPEYADAYGGWHGGLSWLESARLRELGFDVEGDLQSEEETERLMRQPSRRAWVVLEYDGPAYQAVVARARQRLERATALASANAGDDEFQQRLKSAREELQRVENRETRLFVVDVGRDEDALRAKYLDQQRYAIVNGRLSAAVEGPIGRRRLTARLDEVDVNVIRVPHEFRSIVEPFVQPQYNSSDREPRFGATVNFGRRFEPWIVDLALLK